MKERDADMSMTDQEPATPIVKNYITEFLKYAVVGGLAFLVDTGVLVFFKELGFHRQTGDVAIALSTALGFVAGLIFNFIVSHIFVKCAVAFFVLVWNYAARKKFVYKGA